MDRADEDPYLPRRKAKQNKLGTFLQEGIDSCAGILAAGDHRRQKLMVIITDGQPNKCGVFGCLIPSTSVSPR